MEQPAAQDPLIGLTIGNYEITKKLGEGGMGSVYLAEHPLIGKQVALKVLHSEFASNRDVVARFFTEAKSVNDIQHPNIVDIVDYGEIVHESGQNMVYFIMEFLAGESLAQLIRREAPMAPERALAVCMQIADALGASHQHGVVHRDLKPDNVILIQRGRQADFVKVLDFGIAKLTGDQPGSRRTRTGIVMGTPAYMSPEQCEGRGNVDSRTDIYALGILLYEMITGRVPFQGEGYGEVLVQHLTQVPVRPTTIRGVIPPHVEAVCMKALEKRVDDRYPTMEEFMRALQDPVGYVEAHGGLNGFSSSKLQDGGGPAPDFRTPTPSPIAPLTPAPGTISPLTPGVGQPQVTQMTPAPGVNTPYGQQPGGQLQAPTMTPTPYPGTEAGGGRRTGLIIGIAVLVVGIAAGAFFALKGGSSGNKPDEQNKPPVAVVDPVVKKDPVPEVKKDPVPEVKKDPVPAKPHKVSIAVDSNPPGAKVYVGAEKKPRGKTPIKFELEKSDKPVRLTFRMRRHKTLVKTITPTAKKDLEVVLKRSKRGSGKPVKDKPSGNAGDYTVNPFGP